MSYDLTVFRPESAPRNRIEFMAWFEDQSEWNEKHSYNDPAVTSNELNSWFMEMINTFPALNGPYADDANDGIFVTDYCIGKEVIYAAFSWSVAEDAYEAMKATAAKHNVGFYDTSATDGDILFPDGNGHNIPIDNPDNLSSIQQIKLSASPEMADKSVKEILYSKLNLNTIANDVKPTSKKKWWQKIFSK